MGREKIAEVLLTILILLIEIMVDEPVLVHDCS